MQHNTMPTIAYAYHRLCLRQRLRLRQRQHRRRVAFCPLDLDCLRLRLPHLESNLLRTGITPPFG